MRRGITPSAECLTSDARVWSSTLLVLEIQNISISGFKLVVHWSQKISDGDGCHKKVLK